MGPCGRLVGHQSELALRSVIFRLTSDPDKYNILNKLNGPQKAKNMSVARWAKVATGESTSFRWSALPQEADRWWGLPCSAPSSIQRPGVCNTETQAVSHAADTCSTWQEHQHELPLCVDAQTSKQNKPRVTTNNDLTCSSWELCPRQRGLMFTGPDDSTDALLVESVWIYDWKVYLFIVLQKPNKATAVIITADQNSVIKNNIINCVNIITEMSRCRSSVNWFKCILCYFVQLWLQIRVFSRIKPCTIWL